ncbi:DUF4935 domain-containing protein [Kribbella antibiotica]|uniref:DUF4935 domain-containing protein n=1 Tax=Kribbella antibiotica TaxID=190195 RepID=A0A4R4YJF0_9ACTN|nr:PIN domain-containing protein [Kribbella antibiotica]TDD44966.1 DUF4935 domain-containing protein [Kribbella antibiotica]
MLVVLDTTVFGADPMCASDAWGVLAHAAEAWDLKIVVPSVVQLEAVAGYQRSLVGLQTAAEGWMKKQRFIGLGLSAAADDLEMSIHEAAENYGDQLTAILADLNAIIVPVPNVPHSVVVERAVSRRKPCNSSGDGYRDTLNWLTVLELLRQYPDDDLYWVSNNTGDFGGDSAPESDQEPDPVPAVLHAELLEELAAAGFSERVKYAHELRDMVSDLAATLAPELPQDMRNLRSQLRAQTLTRFVAQEVLPGVAPSIVVPRECALPVDTIWAELLAVGELSDFDFEIRGAAGGDQALIDFKITGESVLVLSRPVVEKIPASATLSPEDQTFEMQISKPLVFRGYLATNSVGKPLGGEITKIASRVDDPMRADWHDKDVRDRNRSALSGTFARALAGFKPVIDPKLIESMTPSLTAAIQAMQPNLFPSLASTLHDPQFLTALQRVVGSLKLPMNDPKYMDDLRAALITGRSEPKAVGAPETPAKGENLSEGSEVAVADVMPEQKGDDETGEHPESDLL